MKKTITISALTFFLLLFGSSYAQKDGNINIDNVYQVEKSGTVHLKCDDADVKIKGTDRADAHVVVYRRIEEKGLIMGDRELKIDIWEEDGDLYIEDYEQSNTIGIMGYYSEVYKITIEMPNSMNLKVRGDDGDYNISNVNGEIRMDVDDADARFTSCNSNYFDLDFDDGDIRMDKGTGYLKLDIDDGDFEVENASFTEIKASADDGDIVIETSVAKGSNYNFSIDDGSVDLGVISGKGQFTIYHDDSNISISDEFKRVSRSENKTILQLGDNSSEIKVRTDDGRIRLRTI